MANEQEPQLALLTPQEEEQEDSLFERCAGALFGAAIADAMGWVTEFARSSEDVRRRFNVERITDFLTWEKKTGGRFYTYYEYIQPGEYSDDTQLALCTARSIRPDGTCDVHRFAKTELPLWLDYARGAGATIMGAAKAISRKKSDWNDNFFTYARRARRLDYREAGANGAAMRVAPIALANVGEQPAQLSREVFRNAIVTHGHPRGILGALVYARALQFLAATRQPRLEDFVSALHEFVGADHLTVLRDPELWAWREHWNASRSPSAFEVAWKQTQDEMHDKLNVAVRSRDHSVSMRQTFGQLGCFLPATKGSGTGTVAAAIAIFLRHGRSFKHTVVESVNQIGADTDTIGSMAAGLSGAYLGYTEIPERWASKMQDFGYFLRVSEALTRIALRRAQRNDLLLDKGCSTQPEAHDLLDVLKRREVTNGMRVCHPLFGLGWVTYADSKPVRRKGAGSMLQARVCFDIGQSCVFKSYLGREGLKTLQR